MRVICSQDLEKMLQKQARKVCWKTWAATHECEECVAGANPSDASKKDK